MTKRLIIYILVFNLIFAAAVTPPLVGMLTGWRSDELEVASWILTVPPMTIWSFIWEKHLRHVMLNWTYPNHIDFRGLAAVLLIACCALYYGFMFVVFLPLGRRRGPELALPPRWRNRWRVFALLVIYTHVLWVAGRLFIVRSL